MLFSFSYSLTSVSTLISSDSGLTQIESCQLPCKWQPASSLHKISQLIMWANYVYPTNTTLPPVPGTSKISIRGSPRRTDFENPGDYQVWDSRLWMSTNMPETFCKGGNGRTAQNRNAASSLAPFWSEASISVFYKSLCIFEEARGHTPSNTYSNSSPILSHLYTDRGRPKRALLMIKCKLTVYS